MKKPTAIVHVGSPKAGSSTIQKNLQLSRDALESEGICVAPIEDHLRTYEFFVDRVTEHERNGLRDAIAAQISAVQPEFVIFSTEFAYVDPSAPAGVRAAIGDMFDEIRIILYVWDPVSHYVSAIQQQLKATHHMRRIERWAPAFERNITAWRTEFAQRVTVLPFQAEQFEGGFVRRFLSVGTGRAVSAFAALPEKRANSSEPPEVTQLMQSYFADNHSERERAFEGNANALRARLSASASALQIESKARAKPAVAAYILDRWWDDLLWLRREEAVSFHSVNYDHRPETPNAVPDCRTFADIVEVDPERQRRIISHFSKVMIDNGAKLRSKVADLQARCDALAAIEADAAARKSRTAEAIDFLDYTLHRLAATVSLFPAPLRRRMQSAAERRFRARYARRD